MSDFGIFYPRGHLVVAFGRREDAEQVRRDLLTGGYDPADCLLATSGEVAEAARRNLENHTGFLARLGKSDEAVRKHLEAAREGDTFLLIYAPGDYAKTDAAKAGIEKLKAYFQKTPPPHLHHTEMLLWASTKLDGLMTADERKKAVAALRTKQRKDGGWSLPSLCDYKRRDTDKTPSDPNGVTEPLPCSRRPTTTDSVASA